MDVTLKKTTNRVKARLAKRRGPANASHGGLVEGAAHPSPSKLQVVVR